MARTTNRREFVQAAGLAASGLMAAAGPLSATGAEAQTRATPRTMGARFRELMNGAEPLICANAFDLLTARLIEAHGFRGVFVGSSATNPPGRAAVVCGTRISNTSSVMATANTPSVRA